MTKMRFLVYSLHISTVLELYFDRARGEFRPCLRYVLTELDHAQGMFRPCMTVFDRASACTTVLGRARLFQVFDFRFQRLRIGLY